MQSKQVMTKAETLAFLSGKLTKARVLPLMVVKYGDYICRQEEILRDVCACFALAGPLVIVRSSSMQEDTVKTSNAGKYASVLNVDIQMPKAIASAIETVFDSYQNCGEDEELFIQPMLTNVVCSGVAFTCDIYTGAPYYTINYSEGEDTAAVTSGKTNQLKTVVVFKNRPDTVEDPLIKELLSVLVELEEVLNSNAIDVEFAFAEDGVPYILQARPIAVVQGNSQYPYNLDRPLTNLYKKWRTYAAASISAR